jgi:hypothetical protein
MARTTPFSLSTSGPLVPSPGNGPAVSSGISELQSPVALVAAAVEPGLASREPSPVLAPGVAPGRQAAAPRAIAP